MRHSIRRMPELPDVVVYIEALERRIRGARLERVRVLSPFVLRSVDPPLAAAAGRTVSGLRRLGKRIVVGLESDLFLVLHLMIAGRLHWRPAGARAPGEVRLAPFDFAPGSLRMTESGKSGKPHPWGRPRALFGRRGVPRPPQRSPHSGGRLRRWASPSKRPQSALQGKV